MIAEDHCPAIIHVGISGLERGMSALPPKADIAAAPPLKVSFGQIDNPKVERAEDLF